MATNVNTNVQTFIDATEGSRVDSSSAMVISPVRILFNTVSHVQRRSVTSGYRALVKRGGLPKALPYYHGREIIPSVMKGYFRSYRTEIVNGKEVTYLRSFTDGIVSEKGTSASDSLARLLVVADGIAINNLRNKAKDMKVNGAQAYAESKQVARLIGDAAMKIGEVLHYIRKGNLIAAGASVGIRVSRRKHTKHKRAVSQIKTNEDVDRVLSNGILQVQYGIRPLLSDVIGAAELLAQKNSREVLSTVSAQNSQSQTRKTVVKTDLPYSKATSTLDRSYTVTIRYGIRFSTPAEVKHTLAQLGLTNPLLLAWELLPWSFVIDWFIPIGNYLGSFDAVLGLKFDTGYKSTVISDDFSRSMVLSASNSKDFDVGSGVLTGSKRVFERLVLTDWPLPKLPTFKNPVSFEHALNGIALLSQFKKDVYFRVK